MHMVEFAFKQTNELISWAEPKARAEESFGQNELELSFNLAEHKDS